MTLSPSSTSLSSPNCCSSQAQGGSGSKLPPDVLWSATVSAGLATLLSCVPDVMRRYFLSVLSVWWNILRTTPYIITYLAPGVWHDSSGTIENQSFNALLSGFSSWSQASPYRYRTQYQIDSLSLCCWPLAVYSISSLISLYSLDASFFIDLIRDIYEAFVI